MDSIPWTKKYAPHKISDIISQEKAVSDLKEFMKNFRKHAKKSALLFGPSGTGKTSSVYAIADEMNYEVVEVNASDFRNKAQIDSVLGNALKQKSLFANEKIILVDEIDGLAGTEDRGGLTELITLLEDPKFAVVMTAMSPWDNKFSKIRTRSQMMEFEKLSYASIIKMLKHICEKEKISYDEDALTQLATSSSGDLRGAIIDLQTLAGINEKLTKKSIETLGEREKTDTIINALVKVLKNTDPIVALGALNYIEEDLDEFMLWLDENMPKEYKNPEDLARAYNYLAKADIFRARIKRWQYWRFLDYVNTFLTAGVAVSKDKKYTGIVQYKQTMRLLKIWQANMKYQKRKAIAEKIAEKTHASKKEVLHSTIPYFQAIFKKNKQMSDAIAAELDLDNEEIEWLRK